MSADNWADCPKCGGDSQLREDYEIGILDGVFFVIYDAQCYSCDFVKKFTLEENISLDNSTSLE